MPDRVFPVSTITIISFCANFPFYTSVTKKEASSSKMEVDDFEVIEKFTEYLMYLEGEQPLEERKMEDQKAEIIVVVDKSGSMGGTPWKQVQSALIKMLDITRGVNNCKAIGKKKCLGKKD